jgi:plasmid stabilization system protein ParE
VTLDDEAREYLRRLYTQPTERGHPDRERYLELLTDALDELVEAAERYRIRATRKPDHAEWSFRRPRGDAVVIALDTERGLVAWRFWEGEQMEGVFEPQVAYDPDLDALVGRRRLQDGVRRSVQAEFAMALLGAFTRAP